MKNIIKITLFALTTILLVNCKSSNRNQSTLTGLSFNDPKNGNYIRSNSFDGQKTPLGMVGVEGGSFTMGQVQDDVMFDWNTTPKKIHVRSFYMDEAEVTNSEYFLYVQYMKDVFPPSDEKYKHIYSSILPDTLVWRKSLGNTDIFQALIAECFGLPDILLRMGGPGEEGEIRGATQLGKHTVIIYSILPRIGWEFLLPFGCVEGV